VTRPWFKPLLVAAFVIAFLLPLQGRQAPKTQQGQQEQQEA